MKPSDLRELFSKKLNAHLPIPPPKALLLVSGGLDSVVLLHLYAHWLKTALAGIASAKLSDFLGVLHLDYGLRPKENLQEQALIKNACSELQVPLHLVKAGGPPQKNLQNWARKKRLLAALKKSRTFGYRMVLTAHHLDDLVETFLLKLLKGQSVSALTSFGFKSVLSKIDGKKIFFLRPLVDFEKEDLEKYAKENQLRYQFDSSNALNDYERNYLRNEIVPALLRRFPAAKKNLLTSRLHIKTLKNFLFRLSAGGDSGGATDGGEHNSSSGGGSSFGGSGSRYNDSSVDNTGSAIGGGDSSDSGSRDGSSKSNSSNNSGSDNLVSEGSFSADELNGEGGGLFRRSVSGDNNSDASGRGDDDSNDSGVGSGGDSFDDSRGSWSNGSRIGDAVDAIDGDGKTYLQYFIKDRHAFFPRNFFSKTSSDEQKLVLHQYFSKQCPWKRFSQNDLEQCRQKIVRHSKNHATGKKSSIILLENKRETFFFWEDVIFSQSKKTAADKDFFWSVSNCPSELFGKKTLPSFSLMIEQDFFLSFRKAKKKLPGDVVNDKQKFVLGGFDFSNRNYKKSRTDEHSIHRHSAYDHGHQSHLTQGSSIQRSSIQDCSISFRLTRGVEEKSRISLGGKSVSLLKHLKNEKYPAIFRNRGWRLLAKADQSWQTVAFFCFDLLTIWLLQREADVARGWKNFESWDFLEKKIICSDFFRSEFSQFGPNSMEVLLVWEKNSSS